MNHNLVFLDRDGVINRFPGHGSYVTTVGGFRFIPGAKQALKDLSRSGFKIFVISNQAGVARGRMTLAKLQQIDVHMKRCLSKIGVTLKSFYCTHHPDERCDCRKPGLGNVKKALATVKKPLKAAAGCFFIGDSGVDIQTGQAAGMRTIMVLSGKNTHDDLRDKHVKPDHYVANLTEAVRIVLHEDLSHPCHRRGGA